MGEEAEKNRAARLAALEKGSDVRAGVRTLAEVVALARLQEENSASDSPPIRVTPKPIRRKLSPMK